MERPKPGDVINQIGKPLTAPRTTARPKQANQSNLPMKRSQSNMGRRLPWALPQGIQGYPTNRKICNWLTMLEIRNLSFDTADVVIRDSYERPCYFVSMKAYVNFNGDFYFPLRNLRPHPKGSYRIHFDKGPERLDKDKQHLVLNCSFPDNSEKAITSVSLMSAKRANRAFTEEIVIQVECGYLMLQLRVDGTYLALQRISFYQEDNMSIPDRMADAEFDAAGRIVQKSRKERPWTDLNLFWQRLVFTSTNGTDKSSNPLIVMPAFSRYLCQNRIVLTGNNSVQMVIERFELQRITDESSVGQASNSKSDAYNGHEGLLERDTFVDTRPRRSTTTILYKKPLEGGKFKA